MSNRFLDWPEDALSEVAVRLMQPEENLGTPEVKASVCKIFVTIHMSVFQMSEKMLVQVKRKNYVTPTSYLEFAKGCVCSITEIILNVAENFVHQIIFVVNEKR